ncbi:MAG: DUF2442 domain-containing protein [Mariniphaga sp.]|nr:DUF2442 domain-containing protein [Mariniphaga sp.]
MKSEAVGENILEVEVTNISEHGFWLLIGEKEYFLPFKEFPWFKDATIAEISDVVFLNNEHLFWEKLDIDLTLDMIEYPEKYPLISK